MNGTREHDDGTERESGRECVRQDERNPIPEQSRERADDGSDERQRNERRGIGRRARSETTDG